MSQQFYNKDDDNVIDIDVEKLKKRTSFFAPFIILIILAVVIVSGSIYTLDSAENGVIVRLGKVSDVVEEPGLHFKVPLIDQVRKVNIQTLYNMEYGFRTQQQGTEYSEPIYVDVDQEATVIVDGANNNASIALIELIIQYKVENPVDYLFRVDDVEGTLRLALEDVVRSSVQSFTLEEAKTQKAAIDDAILPALQKKIDEYSTGLKITLVGTQNVQFLPSVEQAYQEKENANQYKNGKIEDGQKYENTVVPQAQAEAIAIIEEANAYAATVKAAASADVAQFIALYEEYQNNPEILKERYYLESMREFLTSNEIVIDLTENQNFLK
jgi:membrane protease subunit HflK